MCRISAVLVALSVTVATIHAQEYWDFQWGGKYRACIVDVPGRLAGVPGLPVVLNLAPYGWNHITTRDRLQTHILGDAELREGGFITVYPNPVAIDTPWGWSPVWNSGISDAAGVPAPNVDDVGFISFIIDSLISRFSIDTTRVYSCGYSNGGFMSIRLARQLGHRIAAVASVAGVLTPSNSGPYPIDTIRSVPLLMMHGTADGDVLYNGGRAGWFSVDETIDFFREKNSCQQPAEMLALANIDPTDKSTVEKYTYRTSTGAPLVVLYKVIGGDHTWPGASFPAYVTNNDIDANREIWDFFSQFTTTPPGAVASGQIPESFSLSQNYPNPFNPSTTIEYSLPGRDHVTLKVYNLLGQEVAIVVNELQPAGYKSVLFDASGLPSGTYLYRVVAGEYIATRKLVLIK